MTSVVVDGSIGRRLSATLSPLTVKYVPYAVSLRVNDGEKETACAGLPVEGSVNVGFGDGGAGGVPLPIRHIGRPYSVDSLITFASYEVTCPRPPTSRRSARSA